jgi:Na+/H+ antiporter NhaD/arsenite permease-like protein
MTALTIALFALIYFGLAVGRWGGLGIDRAGIALVGATLMLICGAVSFRDAVSPTTINYETLALLLGMMIVVGGLHISGFFEVATEAALRRVQGPHGLLALVIALSGGLSMFLINDIVCLSLTPLVLKLTRRLRLDPLPHLVALATAANIGSVGTITGNPQNVFIGAHSHIPYLRFAERLMPVALVGLLINYMVVAIVYRGRIQLAREKPSGAVEESSPATGEAVGSDGDANRWLRWKAATITSAMLALFFVGLPLELVALGGAGLMLLGRVEARRFYEQIDGSLLLLFTGLFVVVHAFRVQVVDPWHVAEWPILQARPIDVLSLVSAGLSNLVSNVPAVLLLEPVIEAVPATQRENAWLALAMSSTLAGNLTILGSVANLIVVEAARREQIEVSLSEYGRVGIPLTIFTLALGIGWLLLT